MERIAEPLRLLGAEVETTDGGAPVTIRGGTLHPIRYALPVASAQVKSAVLLAGLYGSSGPTVVVEPTQTRDHTERLLEAAGARVGRRGREISVWPAERLEPLSLDVPGDFSSAVPFLVAATLLGVAAVIAFGVLMAGWCLQLRQEAWHYPEAIAGALYLISGAIFPIDILPNFLHPIAYASPTTWWLEASRRGLLGHGSPGAVGDLPDGLVMLFLLVSTLIVIPVGLATFAWFMKRARQAGLLDMVTGS